MGGVNNYSTDEQVIGTWINGKPIYRVVENIGQLPNGANGSGVATYSFRYNWLDIFTINLYGFGHRTSNGTTLMLNFANPIANQEMVGLRTSGTNTINIYTGVDRTEWNGYVIVEFTKNSD